MIIDIHLGSHCIETAIRRLHHRYMTMYFNRPPERDRLEARLEILDQAISRWDFSALRSAYPELAGHGEPSILLIIDGAGQMTLQIGERNILPILKS